jgi:hypothetical protein
MLTPQPSGVVLMVYGEFLFYKRTFTATSDNYRAECSLTHGERHTRKSVTAISVKEK